MNRKALFAAAHTLTKQIKSLSNYRATFGLCLKEIAAALREGGIVAMGAAAGIFVAAPSVALAVAAGAHSARIYGVRAEGCLILGCSTDMGPGAKRRASLFATAQARATVAAANVALPAYNFRVTVLEGSVAVGAALEGGTVVSLGRSWRLTEREVDVGARPDWQGLTVQYAYVAR